MGRLLYLADFKHNGIGRKVLTHNRHDGGFEAPRNSFEYGYRVQNSWPEIYSDEASMKRLINQELSKRPKARHNAPSVVARLMGVDTLPEDRKPIRHQDDRKNEVQVSNFTKKEQLRTRTSLGGRVSFVSNSFRKKKINYFNHKKTSSSNRRKSCLDSNDRKPREHPQEEELQKFKKEFEAWQTARFKQYSKVVELGTTPSQWWLAQEDLNKEKMARYANFTRPIERKVQKVAAPPRRRASLQRQEKIHKSSSVGIASLGSSTKTPSPDFQNHSLASSDDISDIFYAPSRIVILRPGPDTISYSGESRDSSPGISDRADIEDFLVEVKERLKYELRVKPSRRSTIVRGGGIETPYNEKPLDAKQIAQYLVKQATLPRSSSTRSFESETRSNETVYPEFVNGDTRRFLAERLRNVLKEEKDQEFPSVVCGRSISSMLNDVKGRAEQSDIRSQSFRRDPDDNVLYHELLSPRDLTRSFSAPVSGTFGKLLLEDRHILPGAHIRRKQEVIANITENVENQEDETLNFREKVESFKYSLRLFGEKIKSAEESIGNKNDIAEDILSEPTVTMNYHDRPESLTEAPPSPESICSSAHEELWRPANSFSPTSTSDIYSTDDSMMPQVFKEISSNLNELRRQLNQLDAEGSEGTTIDEHQNEVDMPEIEDQVESYIKDLLVCSGLYDGSLATSLSRWDPFGRPMSNQVFEEVEESYRERINEDEGSIKNECNYLFNYDEGSIKNENDILVKDDEGSSKNRGDEIYRKIIFDLVNEVLANVLGTPIPESRFKKKVISPVLRPLHGKKLLDRVWEIISVLLYPPVDVFYYAIDRMVARDMLCAPWSKSADDDDVNALGKEIECQIMCDLIEEIVEEMQS